VDVCMDARMQGHAHTLPMADLPNARLPGCGWVRCGRLQKIARLVSSREELWAGLRDGARCCVGVVS
jgi:hypothetical protein